MADILARDLIIDVKSAGQSVGTGAGGTPPPVVCDVLETDLVIETDQTSSKAGQIYTFTGSTLGTPGTSIYSSRYAYEDFSEFQPYIEVEAQVGYAPGSFAFVTFANGLAALSLAAGVEPNTAGPNTGRVFGLSETIPPFTGLDIPAGAVMQVRLNVTPTNFQITVTDEDDNTYLVEDLPFPLAGETLPPLWYLIGAQTPDIGDEASFRFNAGGSEPIIDTAGAQGWCSFTEAVPYVFWTLFTSGDANNNDDLRIAVNTKDGIDTPRYTGTLSWPALVPVAQFNGNLFECEITQNDGGAINFFRVGADAFLSSQLTLDFDGGERLEIFSQGESDFIEETVLCNNISAQVGEVSAVALFEPVPGEVYAAFCTNIGGELVFYDPVRMPPIPPSPGGFILEPTPFMQNWASSALPASDVSKIQFNGIDGDLSITDYPDNFKGYDGREIPGSVSPYTRSAKFEQLTYYGQDDGSPVVDAPGKNLNFTNGPTGSAFVYTQSATLFSVEAPLPVIAMVRLNSVTATSTTGYYFGFRALNRNASYCEFYVSGGDLRFRSVILGVETNTLVLAGWVPAAGHVLAIAIAGAGALAGNVAPILGRGALISSPGPLTFDDNPGTSYLPRAGHDAVPVSESVGVGCQYKRADMDANVVAAYFLGPVTEFQDLEGTAFIS